MNIDEYLNIISFAKEYSYLSNGYEAYGRCVDISYEFISRFDGYKLIELVGCKYALPNRIGPYKLYPEIDENLWHCAIIHNKSNKVIDFTYNQFNNKFLHYPVITPLSVIMNDFHSVTVIQDDDLLKFLHALQV